MKLIDLIAFFRKGGSYEEFCRLRSLDIDSEAIEIYAEKPFHLNSDLAFFEIEKTDGYLSYAYNGIEYSNLFDFYFFLDAIDESNNARNESLTDLDIAMRLHDYAINDA